ncbi:MAG: indole-3-glycerol phosphate synthase TrpC [Acidobacteria bacterium]|nr:MAG: indole-3-glycerol phosphate synthase TrpC [Acidobacteriota bacterium]
MTTILETIFDRKRQRVSEAKKTIDYSQLIERATETRSGSASHRLRGALSNPERLNIIAEFKRASPSKGAINETVDVTSIATAYQNGGACAMSVLTEEDHFNGSLDDLRAARAAVSIPILRKDFVFDEFQIYEAAEAGADAILLIVAALDPTLLASLHAVADDELKMDALVEVHSVAEMEIAKAIGATLIGVNNRDLKTFSVSLDVSRRIIEHAPANSVLVTESGLRTRDELLELHDLGYSGFLMGETLMRSDDPAGTLRGLVGLTAL